MTVRVGINGFGRIGRLDLRAAWGWPEIEFVHINEVKGGAITAAHLLKFDSVHGRWAPEVEAASEKQILIDGQPISFSEFAKPDDVPWEDYGADIVLECSGKFRTTETLDPYFKRGVRKVIVVQTLAPTLIRQFGSGRPPQSKTVRFWASLLIVVPAAIAIALQSGVPANMAIVGGLLIFGVVFAFNSAVHSYLVLAFTDDDKVALNVGFYYMANSGGRLAGTVLSGFVYQFYGLVGCLWVSAAMVLAAAVITRKLPDPQLTKEIAWKAGGGD